MEEDKRNVIMFFAISMLIMLGYPYFFENSKTFGPTTTHDVEMSANAEVPPVPEKPAPVEHVEVVNVYIESQNFSGKFSTCGVRLNDIYLKKYKKNQDSDECVQVLGDAEHDGFAQTWWESSDPSVVLPNEETCWKTNSTILSEESSVVLTWDNGKGLVFEKHISIDSGFLITVVDKVKNYGSDSVSLKSITTVCRRVVSNENSMNFYEGPLGYINGKLEEIKYEDIAKQQEIKRQTKGGWFGITDKYWLTAFIPNQKLDCSVVYRHKIDGDGKNICRIDSSTDIIHVAPSVDVSKTHHLFVGAKEIKVLDMYEEKLGVQHFDLAIDFGCLYILTKPLLYALAYTKNLVGNMGLGIILITLLIKLLLFPLASRSYRSMNRMNAIQPKIQELRKKYEGDNAKFSQMISEIYKEEKINPVGGCLPVLLQSPVLFALYKVLYISIEMRQAPFIWWINDLSAADSATILNLFGLMPLNLPGFLQIGIWPLLMGITMWLQQRMSPMPSDPTQARMMLIMPLMFTFMFAQLPSGLVIYWTFSNILGIIQQYFLKRMDESNVQKAKNQKYDTTG